MQLKKAASCIVVQHLKPQNNFFRFHENLSGGDHSFFTSQKVTTCFKLRRMDDSHPQLYMGTGKPTRTSPMFSIMRFGAKRLFLMGKRIGQQHPLAESASLF
jgi:hypothetical protein